MNLEVDPTRVTNNVTIAAFVTPIGVLITVLTKSHESVLTL